MYDKSEEEEGIGGQLIKLRRYIQHRYRFHKQSNVFKHYFNDRPRTIIVYIIYIGFSIFVIISVLFILMDKGGHIHSSNDGQPNINAMYSNSAPFSHSFIYHGLSENDRNDDIIANELDLYTLQQQTMQMQTPNSNSNRGGDGDGVSNDTTTISTLQLLYAINPDTNIYYQKFIHTFEASLLLTEQNNAANDKLIKGKNRKQKKAMRKQYKQTNLLLKNQINALENAHNPAFTQTKAVSAFYEFLQQSVGSYDDLLVVRKEDDHDNQNVPFMDGQTHDIQNGILHIDHNNNNHNNKYGNHGHKPLKLDFDIDRNARKTNANHNNNEMQQIYNRYRDVYHSKHHNKNMRYQNNVKINDEVSMSPQRFQTQQRRKMQLTHNEHTGSAAFDNTNNNNVQCIGAFDPAMYDVVAEYNLPVNRYINEYGLYSEKKSRQKLKIVQITEHYNNGNPSLNVGEYGVMANTDIKAFECIGQYFGDEYFFQEFEVLFDWNLCYNAADTDVLEMEKKKKWYYYMSIPYHRHMPEITYKMKSKGNMNGSPGPADYARINIDWQLDIQDIMRNLNDSKSKSDRGIGDNINGIDVHAHTKAESMRNNHNMHHSHSAENQKNEKTEMLNENEKPSAETDAELEDGDGESEEEELLLVIDAYFADPKKRHIESYINDCRGNIKTSALTKLDRQRKNTEFIYCSVNNVIHAFVVSTRDIKKQEPVLIYYGPGYGRR